MSLIKFKYDSDTGSDHIKFNKVCPCGEKFSFTESYMDTLGTCAICKNRYLHCAVVVELGLDCTNYKQPVNIHVCVECCKKLNGS